MSRQSAPSGRIPVLTLSGQGARNARPLGTAGVPFPPLVMAAAAFRAFFALDPPRELAELSNLTPGDYAVAKTQGRPVGPVRRPRRPPPPCYGAECDAKPDRAGRIGFGRSRRPPYCAAANMPL